MVDVKIENNTAKVLGEFGSAMGRALYAIGVEAQGDVVKYMSKPDFTGRDIVDTGRLRGSISFVTPDAESGVYDNNADSSDALSGKGEENTVIIGTNVEYANYVNNGTRKQRARKFMENGIEPNWDKYQKIAKDIFEGKL
jgi:HK97 gp10 family phage protein